MSFLFPLYLLGAAAIGIPILLHLRRRPPKEHVEFSSLMFLEKSPERLTRRTRIERWLLLALRCLALILLALVFGRPFFRRAEFADVESGRRLFILVDRSASMRREDLWTRAVAEAEKALKETSPGDAVAVGFFDDRFDPALDFARLADVAGGSRAEQFRQAAADRKTPGWRGTDLGGALIAAAGAIEDADAESKREFSRTEIVVIGDFQEGAAVESLNRHAWPEKIAVRCVAVEPKDRGNLAVHLVAADSRDEETEPAGDSAAGTATARTDPTRVIRRVRLANSRESESEKFALAWAGAKEPAVTGQLPAGASRVLPVPPRADDSTDSVLEISGDAHDFDNRVYIARAQPHPVRLLFLAKETAQADVGSPLFYLRRAMHRTATIDPSVTAMTFTEFQAARDPLGAADVAIVHGGAPSPVAAALGEFAKKGGAVFAVVAEGTAAESLKPILGIEGIALSEAKVDDYAMFSELDFDHPVLAPFARAKVRDFTKVRTWKHRVLTIPETAADRARVLARFDSGDPAWVETAPGEGRVFVFLSGWEPSESQLALSSKFVPLIYAMLGEAGFSATAAPALYAGDALPLAAETTAIRDPAGAETAVRDGRHVAEAPGFYTAVRPGAETVYAVNAPPAESRLEALDPVATLSDLGVNVASDAPGGEATLGRDEAEAMKKRLESEQKESRQKLWKWLVLAALAVLLVETWLAGRGSRRAPAASPAGA
ncbi:MAG: BatA domain-containing protein [Verrucomicrobiae bacterium]|nr:BatA domain-containing protein [Verrucomicrobiae bacterium]